MADMRQNGLCKLTLAPLSDHEEMVSALVHPLVQVYPIPRTGQLAYVGHVCTPRQKVTKCLKSLPVMPADMPVVHVRPRQFKGKPAGRALFKAEVRKRKAAFLWLKSNNLYYANVEWRDDAADAWTGDNVEVGRTREADSDSFHVPAVTRLCFARWMEHARSETLAGDFGYTIRKRIREVIMDSGCDDEEPGSASAIESNVWAAIRRFVSEVFRQNVFRMATTHSQNILAVVLAARGVVDLGLPQDMDPANILRAVRSLDTIDCPMDLHVFRAELEAVMMEEYDENPAGVRWSNRPSRLCWCAPELKIPKVLPKLIPYGTGDYHCDKPGLHPTFRFEEWGRYVMLWHDGRFLRHTRFRFRIAGSGCPANLLPHAQGVRGLHARVSHGQGQAARVGADPLARSGRCARSSRRWSTRSNRRRPTLA